MAGESIDQKAAVYMNIAESHTGTQEELGKKLEIAQMKFEKISRLTRGSAFDAIPLAEKKDLPPEDCSRV